MPTKTKTKPTDHNYKGSGLTYQQWYYRRKNHLPISLNPNSPADQDTLIRTNMMVAEFLDRCELQRQANSPNAVGMVITHTMAQALFDTLRTDGH